jgi:D-serine deaminase-like pyridoxal phosphate-dependent protein
MASSSRSHDRWYTISNVDEIASPALAFFPERIEENIRRMIRVAGDPARLRTHVKTHKTAEIVAMQVRHGIRRFKCSTIAEAEMTASCGDVDVLLAMQPVGPAVDRYFALQRKYPAATLGAIVDAEPAIDRIGRSAAAAGAEACLWLDLNVGMNRTGVGPGAEALRLYRRIHETPGVRIGGLHAYDGHIHDGDLAARTRACDDAFAPVQALSDEIRRAGLPLPAVVAGGSPTFPIHAKRPGVELSPGTTLLWDVGYGPTYPDLEFLVAAVLVTRVVSKPAPGLICLDLGTKAVAAEMPQPRVSLPGIASYRIVGHNEEHLVVETPEAGRFQPGDVVYAMPVHICPTVDRYDSASVVNGGRCTGSWRIVARNRRLTV